MKESKALFDCISPLRIELKLITKKLFECYIEPESSYMSYVKAQDILSAFLVKKDLRNKLTKHETPLGELASIKQVYDLANQNLKQLEDEQEYQAKMSNGMTVKWRSMIPS